MYAVKETMDAFLSGKLYSHLDCYGNNTEDKTKARRYTLDEAMKKARDLNRYYGPNSCFHYSVERVED